VAARVAYRALSATNKLYLMTRHFVWLVPLLSLMLFVLIGVVLALCLRIWPRRVGWLVPRLLVVLTLLPALLIAGRRIHPAAWLIFAMGVASCLARLIERRTDKMRTWLVWSLPMLATLVLIQAGAVFGRDRLKQWNEDSRAPPPSGSPNVLLVVLDTVRADRLSLYGYPRPTSRTLERLAKMGLRFDRARAAAPWTLASHASLFTGRWPHELAAKWMHPLSERFPTLAEYMGEIGYATAGFVGNTFYCSYDSGLDRGFTHYEDYALGKLDALRTLVLLDRALKAVPGILTTLGQFLPTVPSLPLQQLMLRQVAFGDRKDAGVVNREFLDWLAQRSRSTRPFFAFLNYADAHAPYVLPPGAPYRFGVVPQTEMDFLFLLEGWLEVDKRMLSQQGRSLGRDSYDNCLAYLDDRLGELFDELERRGVLEKTLVIVTADHGEGLGEHDLYDHGESLYRPEIRVPLVVVLPKGRSRSHGVVDEFVSLRDLPATIDELVCLAKRKEPFPGVPISRFWREPEATQANPTPGDVVLSELAAPNPIDPNQGRSPARRGALVSLTEGDFVYILNQGDGAEELFDERHDPGELVNLLQYRVRAKAVDHLVQRFRVRLAELRPHP
jgi:arylsulfatase A-like enzyme